MKPDTREFLKQCWYVLFATLVFIAISLMSVGVIDLGVKRDTQTQKPAEAAR